MRFVAAEEGAPLITGLAKDLDGNRCTLRWIWPRGVDAVYISSAVLQDGGDAAADGADSLKLYTKAEYKANNGYICRLEGASMYRFAVYGLHESEDGAVLLEQQGRENIITIGSNRAKIYYSLTEKGGLFRKQKSVQIEVSSEVALGSEVLCYVIKQGGYPASREDGIQYPFVAPFAAGRNLLPPIEIGKTDYIRLFLTNGPKYGQLYELILRT